MNEEESDEGRERERERGCKNDDDDERVVDLVFTDWPSAFEALRMFCFFLCTAYDY